jgi:hypothetical protein
MFGSRFDFNFSLETSQRRFFQLLGAPGKDKSLSIWDRGHGTPMLQAMIKEDLDWFDRYPGPVK